MKPVRHRVTFERAQYEAQAGKAVEIRVSPEMQDRFRDGTHSRVLINGENSAAFAIGSSGEETTVLLATSFTVQPGDYHLTLSTKDSGGEEWEGDVEVRVDPMPRVNIAAVQPPVILLNGFQVSCPVTATNPPSAQTFGSLETQLTVAGIQVFFFDNCKQGNGDESIESLAAYLGQAIASLHYTDGSAINQVDVIAHSMGGLIVRAYLAGMQNNGAFQPPTNPKIRKFIEIATPNFGSFQAFNLGTQSSEMYPGSAFLWNLNRWNQNGDDLRGVDALAIIGDASCCGLGSLFAPNGSNSGDGVVSLSSASLSFTRDASRTRILPYCHTTSIPGCSNAGIANPTQAPETGTIITSFLVGSNVWASTGSTTSPYLAQYGGMYFAVETAAGPYLTDLSSAQFGTVTLQSGGATNSVFFREFVSGTGTFTANSSSVGQISYGPATVPIGRYTTFRAKFSPTALEVLPLLTDLPGLMVPSGATINVNGIGFGSQQCPACRVTASNPLATNLQVLSWNDTSITAYLPSTFTGVVTIGITTVSGFDAMNIMVVPVSRCDVNISGAVKVTDVQTMVSETLGTTAPIHDLNGDSKVNIVDTQIVINAALGQACSAAGG